METPRLRYADATHGGMLTSDAQEIAGEKTFAGATTFSEATSLGTGNTGVKCAVLTGTTDSNGNIDCSLGSIDGFNKAVGWNVLVIYNATELYDVTSRSEYTANFITTGNHLLLLGSPGGNWANRAYRINLWYVD